MKKRRVSLAGLALALLVLLLVAFLLRLTLHRPREVVLPEESDLSELIGAGGSTGRESIRRVEVTPGTVQRAIESLERPVRYSRTVTIERYWSGGSGKTVATVRSADGWTRVDSVTGGGEPRHSITGEGRCWIWYGTDERVYSGNAMLTADEEQSIPTYEDVLLLPGDAIAVADYERLDSVNCIYVETAPDEAGYVERWWVSVENGLLVAAERLSGETVVYRMAGLDARLEETDEDAFTLPDGEVLHSPSAEDESEKTPEA